MLASGSEPTVSHGRYDLFLRLSHGRQLRLGWFTAYIVDEFLNKVRGPISSSKSLTTEILSILKTRHAGCHHMQLTFNFGVHFV